MSAVGCEGAGITGTVKRCGAATMATFIIGLCTIACCACVQPVQSAQIGGHFLPGPSSGHGSTQTVANKMPPARCAAMITRSVAMTPRRAIVAPLYHTRRWHDVRFSALFSGGNDRLSLQLPEGTSWSSACREAPVNASGRASPVAHAGARGAQSRAGARRRCDAPRPMRRPDRHARPRG